MARDTLLRLWIEAEVNRLTNMRASQSRRKGTPGPEGSVGKLAMAGLNQRIMSFVMDLMGPEALLYPSGYTMERPRSAMDLSNPQKAFLRVQANSIEGGTTNIMKNILGERVLGLSCWPSASKVTITSAPLSRAQAIPVRSAVPWPQLIGCLRIVTG